MKIKLLPISILLILVSCDKLDELTNPKDCAGVEGGSAELDNCGICLDGSQNDEYTCTKACDGNYYTNVGNPPAEDNCGVCAGDNSTCFKELDFSEEEVLGKWYRYHGYDDSGRYLILKSDRTGCEWEKPSSGGRKDYESYVYWELQKKVNVGGINHDYYIKIKYSQTSSLYGNDIFKYTIDEIWRGGHEILDMHRSSTSYNCD